MVGHPADPVVSRRMAIAAGVIALSGVAADLRPARYPSASAGRLAASGQDATLIPDEPADSAFIAALVGRWLTPAEMISLGSVYATWESSFQPWADDHWNDSGPGTPSGGASGDTPLAGGAASYDLPKIYYYMWARTGLEKYLTRARAMAIAYRDEYLEPNSPQWSAGSAWTQGAGLALHYLDTGDELSRTALGGLADYHSSGYWLAQATIEASDQVSGRELARAVECQVLAWYIDAPTAASGFGGSWTARAASITPTWVAGIAGAQGRTITDRVTHPGAYRFAIHQYYEKPFQTGLINDALILATKHGLVSVATVLPMIQNSCDFLWDHCWQPAYDAFGYLEGDTAAEPTSGGMGTTPAPDLNNMLTSGFGWVYHQTGETAYKTNGEAIFAGAINNPAAWAVLSQSAPAYNIRKQFTEHYTSSLLFPYWRAAAPLQ